MACIQTRFNVAASPYDSVCNRLTNLNYFGVVSWINIIINPVAVPSGGAPIPVGTMIPIDSTVVPPGTVTLLNGFCGFPSVNLGGIIANNGFFTVPLSGRYVIFVNITFPSVGSVTPIDFRELFVYKVEYTDRQVSQIAVENKLPIAYNQTALNIMTVTYLQSRDRIFLAVRQLNSNGEIINTLPGSGRFSITRIG